MDFEHLRRKGWSEAELDHARSLLHSKPSALDHLSLWSLTLMLIIGSAGLAAFIFPVVLFAGALTIPVSFILGLCAGLLLTHALRSLRAHKRHHVRSTMFLIGVSFLTTLFVTHLLVMRFRIIPGATEQNALLVSVPYVIGMIIPYITERRF